MDIAARIQQLEGLIKEAKSMPLSASVLVNQDELLEVVDGLRKALPEEVKQARWVVKDREELLVKARRDAEQIVEEASKERDRLVSQQEVMAEAAREAERLLAEAQEQARGIRLEAEDYVDAQLAAFGAAIDQVHERLSDTRALIERGRERLRGTLPAEELTEQGPQEEELEAIFDEEES